MKLQTMLLPTGEFILVLSEVDPNSPTGELLNNLAPLRQDTGATAVLVTNESVEVENAFVDETARRRDEFATKWLTGGLLPGEQFFPATSQHFTDESWTTEGLDDADRALLEQVAGGAVFSPAGLVKDGPKSQANLEPELEEALRQDHINLDQVEQPNAMAPYQSAASPGPDAELEEFLPEADEEYGPCDCWPRGGKFQGAQIVRCTSCPFGGK